MSSPTSEVPPAQAVPVFRFDDREKWLPHGVDETLHGLGIKVPTKGDIRTSFDMPNGMRDPSLSAVGYYRMVYVKPMYYHQFWLWYLYNSWHVPGTSIGLHEGDWEFVQTACTKAGEPVYVTGSEHHESTTRLYGAYERDSNDRPVIYVALGSHANYFHAGRLGGGQDECNGKGKLLDTIEWRPFGSWVSWSGRWGGSKSSPESPGQQHERWLTPEIFAAKSMK